MRSSRLERNRAKRVSALIDQQVLNPDAWGADRRSEDAGQRSEDAHLLSVAQRLARLPLLLGPVDPALEHKVRSTARAGRKPDPRVPRLRIGWAVTGFVALLLAATLLTPLGQTAVASFMSVFSLGETEVRITPADTPSSMATAATASDVIQQEMSLEEAQKQVRFAILQPSQLPPGVHLQKVIGNTYPNLPAWVPQPFSVELVYGDSLGTELTLRHYPISLGLKEGTSVSGMNLEATPIQDVLDVDISGQPGVLLRLGSKGSDFVLQEVIWEQDDLMLSLSATGVTEAELLSAARSVR